MLCARGDEVRPDLWTAVSLDDVEDGVGGHRLRLAKYPVPFGQNLGLPTVEKPCAKNHRIHGLNVNQPASVLRLRRRGFTYFGNRPPRSSVF